MSNSTTIIIVNYNSGMLLDKCIGYLSKQSILPVRVLVVDDASIDDSAVRAKSVPGVAVKSVSANLGFASANNLAISESDTEYVVLLNPDAFPEPDWLEKLLVAATKYPEYSAFGSRQLSADSPEILDGTGDVYHISGKVWRNGQGRQQNDSDLIPREIFSRCGRFDTTVAYSVWING